MTVGGAMRWIAIAAAMTATTIAAGAAAPAPNVPADHFAGHAKADVAPPAPAVMPQPSPIDNNAALRPRTEDVGVKMPPPGEYPHPWTYTDYITHVTQFADLPVMNGGVAFVGDSLTDYGRWNEAYPDLTVRNFGIVGDTTLGLMLRLNQVVRAKPDRIFLLIGTNDIEYGRPLPEIAGNVDKIVTRLSAELPKTKIFVESLLPRQPQYSEQVKTVNAMIRKVAAAHKLTYLDIYSHFAVDGGRMDPSVSVDDLHMAGKGYARWRGLIQDYVYTPAGRKTDVRLPHRERPTLKKKGR